jgi:hypothetical protein
LHDSVVIALDVGDRRDGRVPYKTLPISLLLINKANDRHGELESESTAIAWLFSNREQHMRNLARDLAQQRQVYEPPLVFPSGKKFVVFDGNRRVTCLKLIQSPERAPNAELQEFFSKLKSDWNDESTDRLLCQIETDRDRIDDILFRRHTGSQNGVGQSTWDDRMKSTFVQRTGKGAGLNVADEIETLLVKADLAPQRKKIPRSTLNRLLSAEAFRNRVGISVAKGKLEITHLENSVLAALARVANDLASRKVVLGDIWDIDGKRRYLDALDLEGVLPKASEALTKSKVSSVSKAPKSSLSGQAKPRPQRRTTLIPHVEYPIAWSAHLQRHHAIWDELQFRLHFDDHINAIAVLFRVLLEISADHCASQKSIALQQGDKLAAKLLKIAKQLEIENKIDNKLFGVVSKFQHADHLVSADTMNRYVHSKTFAPSPQHLMSLWDSLGDFVVACLKA